MRAITVFELRTHDSRVEAIENFELQFLIPLGYAFLTLLIYYLTTAVGQASFVLYTEKFKPIMVTLLRSRHAATRSQVDDLMKQLKKTEDECELLKTQVANATNDYNKKLENKRIENDQLTSKVSELESALDKLTIEYNSSILVSTNATTENKEMKLTYSQHIQKLQNEGNNLLKINDSNFIKAGNLKSHRLVVRDESLKKQVDNLLNQMNGFRNSIQTHVLNTELK
jgi:hypothetical protein